MDLENKYHCTVNNRSKLQSNMNCDMTLLSEIHKLL